mmetsp:Transcript_2041/g.9251  ORF Transcript_2041/g.9251 Transcript_2041/m.9251 type:complete len:224 (+) Transcript_2041:1360-2031(+)
MPTKAHSYGVTAGQSACAPSSAILRAHRAQSFARHVRTRFLRASPSPTLSCPSFLLYNTAVSPGLPSTSSLSLIATPTSPDSIARRKSWMTKGASTGCASMLDHPAHSWHITTHRSPLRSAKISPAVCVARSMGSVITDRRFGESDPPHQRLGLDTTHRSILSKDMHILMSTTEFITDVSSSSRLARCAFHPGKESIHPFWFGSMRSPTMPSLAPPLAPWSMT